MSALNAEQMRAYATQMYTDGEQLHRTHRSDERGACLTCSQAWPCPDRVRGMWLMHHYRSWVRVNQPVPVVA